MWKQTLLFTIVLIFGAVVFVVAEHVFSPPGTSGDHVERS
jgi:hypothetical protein